MSVEPPADGAEELTGELVVRRPGASGPARRAPITAPGTLEIDLVPPLPWELAVAIEGYWSAPRQIHAIESRRIGPDRSGSDRSGSDRSGSDETAPHETAPDVEVRFSPVPAARLAATLLPDGASRGLPPKATLHLFGRSKRKAGSEPPAVAVVCPIGERKLRCELPAGSWDLKIEVAELAPAYFWGVELPRDRETRLGSVRLRRGASLAGWVLPIAAEARSEVTEVTLVPSVGAVPPPALVDRSAARTRHTRVADNGFFQLTGLDSGLHTLLVRVDGVEATRIPGLVVEPAREHLLEEPIEIVPPRPLEVLVTPPVDPWGSPWRLVLERQSTSSDRVVERVAAGTAREDGRWTSPPIPAGAYELKVGRADEAFRIFRELDTRDSSTVYLDVPLVPIEGSVSMGHEPLAATVWFGGRSRVERVRFESDAEGGFTGYLPRAGRWRLELEDGADGAPGLGRLTLDPVTVEEPAGGRPDRVDIELPDTTVRGEVVHADGSPESDAGVTIWRRSAARRSTIGSRRVDAEGRFLFRGLPEGEVFAEAESFDGGFSRPVAITLLDSVETPPLTLVLEERTLLTGYVRLAGRPIAGASVLLAPRGQAMGLAARAATDHEGAFDLLAPRQTVDLLVTAPALPTVIRRLSLRDYDGEPVSFDLAVDTGEIRVEIRGEAPDGVESRLTWFTLAREGAGVGLLALIRYGDVRESERTIVLGRLETGSYVFCDLLAAAPGACQEGRLEAGGTLTFVADVGGGR